MAIKSGGIVHVGNGQTVIDRIQTGGPGQLNIPTERIYELGNYKSVAVVRDVPDLSFSLESFDVSTEIEAMLTRSYEGRSMDDGAVDTGTSATTLTSASGAFDSDDVGRMVIIAGAGPNGGEHVTTIDSVTSASEVELTDAATTDVTDADVRVATNGIDLAHCVPTDFAGQFKAGMSAADPYLVTASVGIPFLYLEQMSYRFGIRDNATQSATLRGDSIFYNPGACFVEETAGSGVADQEVVTDYPAYEVAEGDARRILAVTVDGERLILGADYTESYGVVTDGAAVTTVTLNETVSADRTIRVMYASPEPTSYPQSVHPDTIVKPAAVKGIDIDVYVGGYDPADRDGSAANKFRMVQSVNFDWRVQLEKDEEFGNHYAVGQDFEVPEVGGTVNIKPRDAEEFLSMIRDIQGITDETKVLGPQTTTPLALDVVIKHPETGEPVKRLHVSDARFTLPGYQGQVQQKMTVDLEWTSDDGTLLAFER